MLIKWEKIVFSPLFLNLSLITQPPKIKQEQSYQNEKNNVKLTF